MPNETGQAVREVIAEYVRQTTANRSASPSDGEPVLRHVSDVYDACELSTMLESNFPESREQITRAMQMLGLNEEMTIYTPEKAQLKTYADLYAALDGIG